MLEVRLLTLAVLFANKLNLACRCLGPNVRSKRTKCQLPEEDPRLRPISHCQDDRMMNELIIDARTMHEVAEDGTVTRLINDWERISESIPVTSCRMGVSSPKRRTTWGFERYVGRRAGANDTGSVGV
jgi:hypothetical protein